jgi:hypothetical protein
MADIPAAEVAVTGTVDVNDAVIDGDTREDGIVAPLEGDSAIAQEQELADERTPSVKENSAVVHLSVLQRLELQSPINVTYANGKPLADPNVVNLAKIVDGCVMLYEAIEVPKPEGSEDKATDVTIYDGVAPCPRFYPNLESLPGDVTREIKIGGDGIQLLNGGANCVFQCVVGTGPYVCAVYVLSADQTREVSMAAVISAKFIVVDASMINKAMGQGLHAYLHTKQFPTGGGRGARVRAAAAKAKTVLAVEEEKKKKDVEKAKAAREKTDAKAAVRSSRAFLFCIALFEVVRSLASFAPNILFCCPRARQGGGRHAGEIEDGASLARAFLRKRTTRAFIRSRPLRASLAALCTFAREFTLCYSRPRARACRQRRSQLRRNTRGKTTRPYASLRSLNFARRAYTSVRRYLFVRGRATSGEVSSTSFSLTRSCRLVASLLHRCWTRTRARLTSRRHI